MANRKEFPVSTPSVDIPVRTRSSRSGTPFPLAKPPTRLEFLAMKRLIAELRNFPPPLHYVRHVRFREGSKFMVDFRDSRFGQGGPKLLIKPPLERFWGRRLWRWKFGKQYHIFRLRKQVHSIQTWSEARGELRIRFQNWLFVQRSFLLARKNDKSIQEDFSKLARGEDPGGWGAPRYLWEKAMYHTVNVPLIMIWCLNKVYWNCYWAERRKGVHRGTVLSYFIFALLLGKKGQELWLQLYTQLLGLVFSYGHLLPPPLPTNAELLRYLCDRDLSAPVRHRYLYGKGNIGSRRKGQTFYPQPPSLIELLLSQYPLRFLLSLACPGLFLYLTFQGFFLGDPFLCFSSSLVLAFPQLLGLNQLRSWIDFLVIFVQVQLRHLISLPYRLLKHLQWYIQFHLGLYLHPRDRPELYRWWRRKLKKFETTEDYAYQDQPPNHRFRPENESWELRFFLGEWAELCYPFLRRPPRSARLLIHLQPPLTLPLTLPLVILTYSALLFYPPFLGFLFQLLVLVLGQGLRPPF